MMGNITRYVNRYLLEETYNTLGRSYARKVNIIKFTNNENYPNAAYYLAKELVGEINAAWQASLADMTLTITDTSATGYEALTESTTYTISSPYLSLISSLAIQAELYVPEMPFAIVKQMTLLPFFISSSKASSYCKGGTKLVLA